MEGLLLYKSKEKSGYYLVIPDGEPQFVIDVDSWWCWRSPVKTLNRWNVIAKVDDREEFEGWMTQVVGIKEYSVIGYIYLLEDGRVIWNVLYFENSRICLLEQ